MTPEQDAIRDMAGRLLAEKWRVDLRRAALDDPPVAVPESLWKQVVEAGWLGVNAREMVGGIEQDLIVGAMLVEQAGQHLFPNTLITALVAAFALDQSGCEDVRELCEGVISGQKFVSVAIENHPASSDRLSENRMEGPPTARGGAVSGRRFMVPDLERANQLIVLCLVDDRPTLLLLDTSTPGLSWEPLERIDGQSYYDLRFDNVPLSAGRVIGATKASPAFVRRVRDYWTLLLSADLLGCTTRLLQQTVAYAQERIQFGKPIGSFQAVSHRLADIKVAEEIGRSLLYGASLSLEQADDTASLHISAAKSWLSEAAVNAGEAAIQLHGGIGYTWELDVHLYLRQARCNAVQLGDARFHRERVAAYVLDGALPE